MAEPRTPGIRDETVARAHPGGADSNGAGSESCARKNWIAGKAG